MVERKNVCPKCGYTLLAISGNEVVCLHAHCDWSVKAKRGDDGKLPNFEELKKDWT